ncbi:MAG: hypothetical protein M1834_007839 [Cirrosporium novae-zelandiae]|nr:MAG: hypothetical protein M1834_007839 [Cirrosporium novae-zelandiae]
MGEKISLHSLKDISNEVRGTLIAEVLAIISFLRQHAHHKDPEFHEQINEAMKLLDYTIIAMKNQILFETGWFEQRVRKQTLVELIGRVGEINKNILMGHFGPMQEYPESSIPDPNSALTTTSTVTSTHLAFSPAANSTTPPTITLTWPLLNAVVAIVLATVAFCIILYPILNPVKLSVITLVTGSAALAWQTHPFHQSSAVNKITAAGTFP